ncbi:MAG: peptidylprolyl isomerase [Bacteroidia bacterium]
MKIIKIFFTVTILGILITAAQQPEPKKKSKEVPKKTEQKPVALPKEQLVEITTDYGKMILKLYNETPLHRDNFIRLIEQGFYDSLLFHRVIQGFMIQGGDPNSKLAPPEKMLGDGDVGYYVPAEFNPRIIHKRGALAAARDNNPARASSGCQFYIVQGRTYTNNELTQVRNQVNYQMKTKLLQDITTSDSVKQKTDDFVQRGDKDGLHTYYTQMQSKIEVIYKKMEFNYTPYQIQVYTQVGGTPQLDMNYTVFGELVEGFNVLDSIASVKTGQADRPLKDVRMQVHLLK